MSDMSALCCLCTTNGISYVLTGSSSKFLFHKKSAYTCLTTCSNMTLFGLRLSVHFGASKLSPLLYVTRAGVVAL